MKKSLHGNSIGKLAAIALLFVSFATNAQTYYNMSSGNYLETFTNWTTPATGVNWSSVGILAGTIPSPTATTYSSATFTTTTSGGLQNGTTNIQFLSNGATNNANALAFDLNLNFTGRTAGTLAFDAATVFNGTGDRGASLQVYYSTNGTAWTQLTGTNLPYLAINNVAGSAAVSVSLPAALNNQPTVKLRFYNYNGPNAGTTGSRPKISLDNVAVSSSAATTVAQNGVIAANEYGNHTDGANAQSNGSPKTYMTWDATNLYIGVENATIGEGFVLYLDKDPQFLVNGGTNANGTNVGNPYDGTNFAELPYRADLVLYVKSGYREYRTADGANGWSGPTSNFGAYGDNTSNTREFSIPWSAIGGQPAAFNFFSFVTSSTGFVYAQTPTENPGGFIGTSARYSRYYTVSQTAAPATLPFSRNSYVFTGTTDATNFGAINAYDFTMNTAGRFISRSGNVAGDWTISGNLRMGAGTIYLGSSGGTYGTTNITGNLNLQGGTFDMDATTAPVNVFGNIIIASGATLKLSTQVGGDINAKGDWTNNGTFTPNSRTVKFNGTVAQTLTGATTFDYFRLNNTLGLTLASAVTVNTEADLFLGKVTLGANNFTMGASALFINQSANSYLVTNGTGKLVRNAFGSGSKPFPVGLATSYTPLNISNTGTVSTLSLGVSTPPTNAVSDPTKIVNLQWDLTSATAGAVADITFNWNVANQASGFVATGQGELGNYTTGPNYTTTNIGTLAGQSKAVTGIALTTGSNKLVIGNTSAVYAVAPANDDCAGAINLVVDAAAVSGTFVNSTPMTGATKKDVFFMFTPTFTGSHTVTINGYSASGDRDLYVYSICPSTYSTTVNVVASGTGLSTSSETATGTFNAGTSYKILVQDFTGTGGTFNIAVTGPPATLTATPASLTFASTAVLTNSASQTVTISGSALTPATGNITVTAPNANFQVSADNINFGATASIPYTSSTLVSTPVYVRFSPQSSGSKTGNLTFSGGGVLTPPTVALTGAGELGAPVAQLPTNITTTSFDANWTAVTGATGYLLDVSTSSTFSIPGGSASVTESFETGLTTTYQTGNVTLSTGVWDVTNVRVGTMGVNSGTASAQLQSATGSALISPTFTDVTTVSFWVTSSTTSGAIQVNYSTDGGTTWTPASNSPFTGLGTTKVQKTVTLNVSGAIKLQFLRTAATIYLDDIVINTLAETPSFVSGYNALAVGNVLTYTVTGLMPFTDYYYRVRATDGTPGPYSNTQSAKTLPETVIWNGTSWSNTVGPDITKKARIQGVYNTGTNGAFQAYNLNIDSGSLTIATGTNITVKQEVTNSLTAAALVIQNDANLLQIDNTTNVAQAKVYRNSAPVMRQDYTMWSSPVTGQNLQEFSPGTLANRFYTYDPSTDLYVQVASPSTTDFNVTTGYLIRASNTHPTTPTIINSVFTGNLNNGPYNMATVPGTFNAIGNPYPSTMSADDFINVNSLVDPLYFWRKTNNAATTSYATYTLAGGTGTSSNPGDPNNLVPNGIINVGQGFIVKATSTLHLFSNLMRTASNNGQFLRTNDVERNRVWVNLTNSEGIFSQTMVAYMTGATMNFDNAIDGKYFNDSQTALTSIINNEEYAIQGRALPFDAADVVPMGFKTTTAGNFTIGLDHFDGLFDDVSQAILLRDNLTGAIQDLRASSYTFATASGVFNERFELLFQTPLKTNVPTLDANSVVVYKSNGAFTINSGINTMTTVAVYDVQGRLLASKKQVNNTQTTLNAIDTNQVLLIQITLNNGAKITKKVVN